MNYEAFDTLVRRLEYLEARVNEQDMMMNNMFREAKILEVDGKKGLARVDAHGVESELVPWLQRAGKINDWDPPTKDERVLLFAPSGDITRGLIMPGGYSDKYKQPHDKLDEAKRVVGETSILSTQNSYTLKSPTITIEGNIYLKGQILQHNQKSISDTHKHEGVTPGGGLTSVPA